MEQLPGLWGGEKVPEWLACNPILAFCGRKVAEQRGVAARLLCRRAGLTQHEAAAVLGMSSGAAVAFQLQRLAARLEADRALRRQLATLERELSCRTCR